MPPLPLLASPPQTGNSQQDAFNRDVAQRLNALVRRGFLTKTEINEWAVETGAVTDVQVGDFLDRTVTGPITTIRDADSGAVAGSYTNANITVNAKGKVTAAASGSPSSGSGGDASSILYPPGFVTANNTQVVTQNSGDSYFFYMGQAKAAWTSIKVRYRVTRAIATVTWAELAIYKGAPVIGTVPASLTRVGYTDTSAIWLATGQLTTTVNVTGVSAQDDLWVVFGNAATTTLQYRAGSVTEDIGSGVLATMTGRPSTTDPATVLSIGNQFAWIAMQGA